jgi:hypothetical protein
MDSSLPHQIDTDIYTHRTLSPLEQGHAPDAHGAGGGMGGREGGVGIYFVLVSALMIRSG